MEKTYTDGFAQVDHLIFKFRSELLTMFVDQEYDADITLPQLDTMLSQWSNSTKNKFLNLESVDYRILDLEAPMLSVVIDYKVMKHPAAKRAFRIPMREKLKHHPTILERAHASTFISLSRDFMHDYLREVANKAGYAGLPINAVQTITVEGVVNDIPEIVIMVSPRGTNAEEQSKSEPTPEAV
jgi:uncharacterized protein Usg